MAYKALHLRSDDDVLKIVKEDFEASEYDRAEKNEQNYQAYRLFQCRDMLRHEDVVRGGEQIIGAFTPTYDLERIDISKAFMPWLRGVVLTSVARIAHGLWPDFNDFYRIDPDDEGDVKGAEAAFGLTSYFIRASRYKQECMLTLLNAHLFDFGILYTGWRNDVALAPRVVDSMQQIKDFKTGEFLDTGEVDSERREIVYDEVERSGWDVASINTFNFRVDPMATHEGFGEFCGITTLIPKRRMHELAESGDWSKAAVNKIDDDEEPNIGGEADNSNDIDNRIREDEGHSSFSMNRYIAKRYVRAEMIWTPTSKAVVLNGKVVAMKEQSWRIPFHKTVFLQKQGMFGGDSMVGPLVPVQVDINQCLRLVRTQQDRSVNPDSLIDVSFFTSPEEAEAQPWGTGADILLSRGDGSRDPRFARQFVINPGNTAPDIWTSITIQKDVAEQSVGVNEGTQGQVEGGATATAVRDAQAGANIRFAFIEIPIEESLVIGPIDDLIKLIQLNVSERRGVQVRGEEGMQWQSLGPQDMVMKKSPNVIALGMSSMASRQVAAQAVRDLTLALSANPVFQQHLNVLPSLRELYRMLDVDPDTFLNDADPSAALVVVPPAWVPWLLANGKDVPVNAFDDHEEILLACVEFTQGEEFANVPEANKRLFLKQIKLRKAALQASSRGALGAPSLPNEAGGGGGMGDGIAAAPDGMQPSGQPSQPMPMQSPRPQQAPMAAQPAGGV